ncbi:hypothetical protein U1Q18_000126 [Sarracenia purpurea var. burkii]
MKEIETEELDRIRHVDNTFLASKEHNRQSTPIIEKPTFKDVMLGAVVSPRPIPPETTVQDVGIVAELDDDVMDNIPISKLKFNKEPSSSLYRQYRPVGSTSTNGSKSLSAGSESMLSILKRKMEIRFGAMLSQITVSKSCKREERNKARHRSRL